MSVALKYAQAQGMRRRLIEQRGIDQWLVSATPTAKLHDLEASFVQLSLVPDVESPIDRMLADGCEMDEIASVVTFATGRFVEAPSLGGDEFGGWVA